MPFRDKLRELAGVHPRKDRSITPTPPLRTSVPIRATSPSAFNLALQAHVQKLDPLERTAFNAAYRDILPETLLSTVRRFDDEHKKEARFRQCAGSISRVLHVMEQFMNGVAIGIQSNPEISSLVVGAVRIVIDVAVKFVTFFSRLTEMMVRISDHLDYLREYAKTSDNLDIIQIATANVYGDILDFHRKARLVFVNDQGKKRRWPSLRQFWVVQWVPFEEQFGAVDAALQHHLQVLDHSAQAIQLNAIQSGNYEASEERRRVQNNERIATRKKCLQWISAHNYEADQNNLFSKRHGQTGEWFLQTREFSHWSESNQSAILWCFGKPGAGKSVLASIAIEHLTSKYGSNGRTAIVFSFIKYDVSDTQNPSRIVSNLIKQICWNQSLLPPGLLDFYRTYDNDAREPSFEHYVDMFLQLAQSYNELFIVIDALDECPLSQRKHLLKMIIDVVDRLPCTRVLLTSRRESDIEKALARRTEPVFEIKAENVIEDITGFVNDRIETLIQDKEIEVYDPQLKAKIIDTLITRAEGMFLWVDLQLSNLCQQSTRRDIERELDLIPRGLDNTYNRILQQIDQQVNSMRVLAQKSLMWVIYSEEPLNIGGFEEAVSIDGDCKSRDEFEKSIYSIEAILKSCCNLLVMNNDSVRLAHYSIREYLTKSSSNALDIQISKFFLQGESAERQIAKLCMMRMILEANEPQIETDYLPDIFSSFLIYSCTYFDAHLLRLENVTEDVEEMVRELFKCLADLNGFEHITRFRKMRLEYLDWLQDAESQVDNASAFIYSTGLYDLSWLNKVIKDIEVPPEALIYASQGGSVKAVATLLEAGENIDKQDKDGNTALLHAALRNHEQIVSLLIKASANVHICGDYHGNPLHAASGRGHFSICQALIEAKADVNAQGGSLGYALEAASNNGFAKTVRLLLDNKADVNAQGGEYGNALQAAAKSGNSDLVQMLLDAGADVNAQGGLDGTALISASSLGYEEIVQMLLDNKADPNAQGDDNGSALQAAAAAAVAGYGYGNTKIVRMLLDAGADVNTQGGLYGNALQAAAWSKNAEIVRWLLDVGADVNTQGGQYGNALQAASSESSNDEIVRILLDAGADLNAHGGYFGDALFAAVYCKCIESVRILLQAGAAVNVQSEEKCSPLLVAAKDGEYDIVKCLLDAGADINARQETFGTPLHVARARCHEDVIQLLLECGAIDETGTDLDLDMNDHEFMIGRGED